MGWNQIFNVALGECFVCFSVYARGVKGSANDHNNQLLACGKYSFKECLSSSDERKGSEETELRSPSPSQPAAPGCTGKGLSPWFDGLWVEQRNLLKLIINSAYMFIFLEQGAKVFLLDSQRGSYLPKDCHCCRRRAVCWGELRASGQDARVPVPFLPLNSLFLCSSWGFFFSTYEKVIVIFPVPTTWGAEERKYVKTQWEVQREFILSHKMVIDLQLLVVCG